jgi:hypothetical protein
MRFVTLAVIVFALSACATIGSLQSGAGGSMFEIRDKNYDEIWKASVRVVTQQLTIVRDYQGLYK